MAETIFETGGMFINIPLPIITDILARLPPKAVIRCHCVCKAWLNLISQSEFVDLHLSKSPICLIVLRFSGLYSSYSATFSLVEVEDETDHHGVRPIAGTDIVIPKSHDNTLMTMIGSIDGLVCINEFQIHSDFELIHVWNPYMREFISLQTPGGEQNYHNIASYGFGIRSGKYVVVRIFQKINDRQQICDSLCHVYTVGDGVWKSIGHAPYLYRHGENGLFFNGCIHWLAYYDKDSPEQICRFDLEKELFQAFPPPPELCEEKLATLNLYNGCLSVCDSTSDYDIVIWVMKEYGVQNSWSKEVVISQLGLPAGEFYIDFRIIKLFKDGEILLLCRDDILFSYNSKRKMLEDIDVAESMIGPNETYTCFETKDYVSSIVSLKSLGEVNVSRS